MNQGEVGGSGGSEGWAKGQWLPLRPNTQGLQLGTWGPPRAPPALIYLWAPPPQARSRNAVVSCWRLW